MPRRFLACLSLLLLSLLAPVWLGAAPQGTLFDFTGTTLPAGVQGKGAALQLVPGAGPASGAHALEVTFDPEADLAGVEFTPAQPWDWSRAGDFSVAVDIANRSAVSVHLYAVVTDASGASHTRSVAIAAGDAGTYAIELAGPSIREDSGMRDDPTPWLSAVRRFIWQHGKKQLDVARITSIRFHVESVLHPKRVVLDNLRVIPSPTPPADLLVGIIDEFGQASRAEFALKVHSEAELRTRADAERAALAKSGPLPDRSRFGGWKNGPKLKATGFFRTEKVGGKWALVDPEGYLFWASGIANVRMANTPTITGVDFAEPTVRAVDPHDVTPEDSKNLIATNAAARATRFIASETRHKLFQWLPPYDHPLAEHYSYERSTHKGPVKHGESFSFYQANLERRYGETSPGSYLDVWRDVTAARMIDWGFTCMGNWVDPVFYQLNQVPYFANGWIIGDFKTISSGHDVWAPMPDVFDPEFTHRTRLTTRAIGEEVKGNPWCVGVFVDNEKSWGRVGQLETHYGIVITALRNDAAASPCKTEFTRLLREKHGTIAALNAAWGAKLTSWEEFARGYEHMKGNDRIVPDYSLLLRAYADKYFGTVRQSLREVLPNHLYMGVRMAHWGMTPEVVAAAKAYTDVISYNYYKEGLRAKPWAFLADIDMPSLIGEFHMGAMDTGFFDPGLIGAVDQTDRARMFKEYMESVIDNPWFVGAHWFQYTDSPVSGRAHDGENYNIGFVTNTDLPYPQMAAAAKELHRALYPRRYGDAAPAGKP